jgi:hypothetical protein
VNHFGLVSQTPFDLMRVGCPVQFSEIDQLKITMEIARRNTEAGLGAGRCKCLWSRIMP